MTARKPPRFMRLFLLGFALGTAGLVGVQTAHADGNAPTAYASTGR